MCVCISVTSTTATSTTATSTTATSINTTGMIASVTSISPSYREISQDEEAFTSNAASTCFAYATSMASDAHQNVSELLNDVYAILFLSIFFKCDTDTEMWYIN